MDISVYLLQHIRQGTWQFPCNLQRNTWQRSLKFPCTMAEYMEISMYLATADWVRYMEISMYHMATLAKPTWKRDFRVRYT